MTPNEVRDVVGGYPHSPHERGVLLYEFIREKRIRYVLELGFNHGVSTCYAAAAIASQGEGRVVTVDRQQTAAYEPNLEIFLTRLGLRHLVTPFYEYSTYNWRLHEFLRMNPRPIFDLVFLDGGHLFEPDALAFLLSEMLVRPGGHFIFDDINWSLASSATAGKAQFTFSPEEIEAKQVREIVDVLVRPHPNIETWWEDHKWGFARKKPGRAPRWDDRVTKLLDPVSQLSHQRAVANFPIPIKVDAGMAPVAWQSAINRGVAANVEARQKRNSTN